MEQILPQILGSLYWVICLLGDMMSQMVDLTLKELALGQLELQMVLSETLQHNVQVM